MRFVILTQYFPPEIGAAQTRLAAFARELTRAGHNVEIVTTMPSYWTNSMHEAYRRKLYVREVWSGMTVHRCWSYAATGTGLRRMANYLSFTLTCLLGLLKTQHADYIFVESPPLFLCIPAWIISRLKKSEIIFNVADLWPDSVKDLGILRDGVVLRASLALERWAYRQARYVTAVTKGICEAIVRKGVPEKKLVFLPNGVDIEMFAPRSPDAALIEELGLKGKHVVLFAGTHGIAQGLETLVEAARLLRDEPFVFIFVGDGGRKASVKELAKKYMLSNVRFVDAQPLAEMPRYFSVAVASIVPLVKLDLFKSARPSKIFPSLASGIPVIYCGEGEAVELLTSAGAGIAVEPQSPELLAGAIRTLGNDTQIQEKLSHKARNLAVKEYSWSSIIDQWLASIRYSVRDDKVRRVAISGLPFVVNEFFNELSETTMGWNHEVLYFHNRLQWFVSVWNLMRSDVWYSIGAPHTGRLFDALAYLLKKPRVMHWVGSDIVQARNEPTLIKRLNTARVLHLAVTERNGRELRELGLDPRIAPLPPTRTASEVPALPEIFTVLLYVPAIRVEFYGGRMYEKLIEDFQSAPVRFLIAGGGNLNLPSEMLGTASRVENLGYCTNLETVYPRVTTLLRMTERDGLSLMVLEALSFGRHVLWSQDFPFVTSVNTYSQAKETLSQLLEKHLEGKLEPQYTAAAHVNETYGRHGCLRRIAEFWTASCTQNYEGRTRASLPV